MRRCRARTEIGPTEHTEIWPGSDELVRSYLAGDHAADPFASPLHDLAASRVHPADDEALPNDSVRCLEPRERGGRRPSNVWQRMVHGFLDSVGRLTASTAALRLMANSWFSVSPRPRGPAVIPTDISLRSQDQCSSSPWRELVNFSEQDQHSLKATKGMRMPRFDSGD